MPNMLSFGFPDQNSNNPVNTMILFVKRFLYSCKFSGTNPNVNTLLRQVKEVCKIKIIKNEELNLGSQAGMNNPQMLYWRGFPPYPRRFPPHFHQQSNGEEMERYSSSSKEVSSSFLSLILEELYKCATQTN